MRYYDKSNKRLIWINAKANAGFWADQWEKSGINNDIFKPSSYISRMTQRYLKPADGPILEAGCGKGNHVYALKQQGYQATGVDFAEKTVDSIKALKPELDIQT